MFGFAASDLVEPPIGRAKKKRLSVSAMEEPSPIVMQTLLLSSSTHNGPVHFWKGTAIQGQCDDQGRAEGKRQDLPIHTGIKTLERSQWGQRSRFFRHVRRNKKPMGHAGVTGDTTSTNKT